MLRQAAAVKELQDTDGSCEMFVDVGGLAFYGKKLHLHNLGSFFA